MNKFNLADQVMDEVPQTDPTKFQTNKKDCCSKVLLAYLTLMFLALIAIMISTIIAVSQNTDWREGRIFGEIFIPISFILALFYLYYIYQLNQFYQPRLIEESYFLDMNQKFSSSFCAPQEQIKFLPIHYFFLIPSIVIVIILTVLDPQKISTEPEQQECQPNDVKNCPSQPFIDLTPYQKSSDPQFLTGWLLFSLIFMRIILIQQIVVIISQSVTRCRTQLFQYPKIYKRTYMNRIKRQAKICLTLFFFYSIFKIIIYIIVLSEYHNQSSIVVITSNIYYHLIMISIIFRTLYLIQQSENNLDDNAYVCANVQDNFYNYMSFIIQIFEKDKINKILLILSYLTIPYIIVGVIVYDPQEEIFNYVSTEAFIYYDCVAAQLFSVCSVIFMFVIHPIFGPSFCSKCYKEENLMQRETSIYPNIHAEEKPYIHINQLNQNVACCCVICLLQLKLMDNNSLVRINCHQSHIFHQECIDQWLKNHNNCPICLRTANFIGN